MTPNAHSILLHIKIAIIEAEWFTGVADFYYFQLVTQGSIQVVGDRVIIPIPVAHDYINRTSYR